ncbi:MAG: DNA polymerase, partial [Candidatus Gastranaerophilaceae bacterium]
MGNKRRIDFVTDSPIYKPSDIEQVLKMSVNNTMTVGNNKGIYYFNVPCSFDIETTSFYVDENGEQIDYITKMQRKQVDPNYNPEKRAIMYVWQFGINGRVIMGRTWEEFFTMLDKIATILRLDEKKRLMVFVHNLSYEFQYLSKWVNWYKVFAIDERKPIYAVTENFIEFRCSYLLSGYSLANLGKQLLRYKVDKMTGDLDYSLMRNSETPLTDKEIKYCVNDDRVVMAYIQEKIEDERGITNLPITKTGYVRQFCRKNCLYLPNTHSRNNRYYKLIHELTISNMKEFNLLQRAFQGGFTHANAYYSGAVCDNVSSYDFTSSYPYVMVSEKFPMSRAVKVDLKSKEEFEMYINNPDKYLSVFDIMFENLIAKEPHENPISVSKCFKHSNVVENNGRVVCADMICTSITNIDFDVIKMFYTWDSIRISNLHVYTKQYLPTELVKCILDLYEKKTVLKNVEG